MDDRRMSCGSAAEGSVAAERPVNLAMLGEAIQARSEWYCTQAVRVLQTNGQRPRWNALELFAMLVGATLAESSVRRALRWIEREARTVSLETLLAEVHALCFVVLESVEDDPELFSDALRVVRALEADLTEAASRTSTLYRARRPIERGTAAQSARRPRLRAAAM